MGSQTGVGQDCPLGHAPRSFSHSPPAPGRCHRCTGTMCQHKDKEMRSKNNTNSSTLHFRAHAARWEHWKGLQISACLTALPLLQNEHQDAGVVQGFWPLGCLLRRLSSSLCLWVWSLLASALLPAHHCCARPGWSHHPPLLPLGWQERGQAASKAPQHSLPSACRCSRDFSCFSLHTSHLQKSTWQLV